MSVQLIDTAIARWAQDGKITGAEVKELLARGSASSECPIGKYKTHDEEKRIDQLIHGLADRKPFVQYTDATGRVVNVRVTRVEASAIEYAKKALEGFPEDHKRFGQALKHAWRGFADGFAGANAVYWIAVIAAGASFGLSPIVPAAVTGLIGGVCGTVGFNREMRID